MSKPATFVRVLYENKFLRLEEWEHPVTGNPWYIVRCTDSVAGILHDVVNKRVLLIRSPHIAVQTDENPTGELITPFAGRFDRNVSPKQLCVAEGSEELGATIPEESIIVLNNGVSMVLSVGIIPERTHLCYAQITIDQLSGHDDDTFGLAGEGEEIIRHWVSEEEFLADTYVCVDLRVYAFRLYIQNMRLKEEIRRLKAAPKTRWPNTGGM
ncbi:MAG: hypothetical protein NTX72_01720 [Candidatus Uhrbacteria bacterium]|nr:hypothetical protein [Candidatus Uhrbacteria bacterium]